MDINGGTLTNGNPIWPGAVSTGPLIAGNIQHGDGVSPLAGAGAQNGGFGNAGYAVMGQFSAPISQASAASGVTTQIVLPAQSMLLQIIAFVTTAFTGGATTFTITDTSGNSYTASGGGAGGAIGAITVAPPATKAIVQQWMNVGNSDVQLVITATNTGAGQMVLFARYLQGSNSAQST